MESVFFPLSCKIFNFHRSNYFFFITICNEITSPVLTRKTLNKVFLETFCNNILRVPYSKPLDIDYRKTHGNVRDFF